MNNQKSKVWTISAAIVLAVTVLVTVGLMYKIISLDMLPAKYLGLVIFLVVFLLLLITALFFFLPIRREDDSTENEEDATEDEKTAKESEEPVQIGTYMIRALGIFLATALVLVDVVGIRMVNKFEETMSNLIENESNETVKLEEFIIGVYVRAEDKATNLEDVKRRDFAYSLSYDRNNVKKAINMIENELDRNISLEEYTDIFQMVDDLLAKEKDAIILSTAYMDILVDQEGYEDLAEKMKCVHECVVTIETQVAEKEEESFEVTEDPFVIYISGHDTTFAAKRANSDVNILGVVNPKTKQVLLINTPRDSYVEISVSDEGELDKLTHCGTYGVDCSIDTLNELYDIDIRYYAQLNFTGFVQLVDALGGIDVYSEKEFVSTSMELPIQQGWNHLDGLSALEFVRERKQFPGGDRMRGRHQMAVVKGIIAQMSSGNLLRNYDGILASMGGYFKTSVPQEDLSALVKMQLSDLAQWNVQMYSVTGTGDNKTSYSLPNLSTYVMILDDATVTHAKTLIQMVYDGETIEEEDLVLPEQDK